MQPTMPSMWIDEGVDVRGKVVLVRAGLNVPMDGGAIINDFRIRTALPTLQFLHEQGARVIVTAHIGRDVHDTLAPVAEALGEQLPITFSHLDAVVPADTADGEIVLLENLRQDGGEVANDDSFAQRLAGLADIFVQDAFSVCHREHASIVGVPNYLPSYGGLRLRAEIKALTRARTPETPALCILGGAKFETKEPLIRVFLNTYTKVFIGGALQNEVLAARGFPVGASKVEDGKVPEDLLTHEALYAVSDVVVQHADERAETVAIDAVGADDIIVDIGPASTQALIDALPEFKTILWNGPFGWYEKGYDAATVALARAVATADAETIIGGGDTVAVVQREGLEDDFDFISTGGGAMLTFLETGTLPGIDALTRT